MNITAWIQGIGFAAIVFVAIGLVNHIIERLIKPMEEMKEKLDEVLTYMKESETHLQDISENTYQVRPDRKSLLTDEDMKKL